MIMVFQLPININMGTSTSFNRFDKDTASGVYSILSLYSIYLSRL